MSKNVYWVTGLSGVGKTTIGKALQEELKKREKAVALLDGDSMREAFCEDLGYTYEERKKCSARYARLCKLLSEQEISVICCTVSMFDDIRQWNRDNIDNYIEVYVKASKETLVARDQKQMHSKNIKNIAGFDLKLEEPKAPDIVIKNEQETDINQFIIQILNIEKE